MNLPLISHIQTSIATFTHILANNLPRWTQAHDPQACLQFEVQVHELTRLLADLITASLLKHILSDPTFQAQTVCKARQLGPKRRHGGARPVNIRLLGGSTIKLTVPYLKAHRPPPRRGPRRKSGNRGKGGSGLYPTLAALGIWAGATPALTAEVVHQMSALDSHQAAFDTLARRGITWNSKVIRRIFYHFAKRACEHRNDWIERINQGSAPKTGPLAGKRVVICTDGGRTRIRKQAIFGRRRRRTRHRGFKAPWKEPKLLIIYLIDDQGQVTDSFRPVLDATMGDANEIFEMLIGYLRALGATEAKELIVVSDGAPWIWERIGRLADNLGVEAKQIVEVVDFYHAVEKLHRVADVPRWKRVKGRQRWLSKAKKLLKAGHIEALLRHIRSLAVGRRAKAIMEHTVYFERHGQRMRYQWFRARRVPIGSGAVESAVRRVINLRLKSNGKFWLRENANAMLLIRSYLKAGRLGQLLVWSLRTASPWWCDPGSGPLFDSPPHTRQDNLPAVLEEAS
jgi:hypothetical protein